MSEDHRDDALHAENLHDEQEHSAWLHELQGWRTDHLKTRAILRRMDAALLAREASIEAQLLAIHTHHRSILQQERARTLAEPHTEPLEQAREHERMHQLHEEVRQRQDELRAEHQNILTLLEELGEALTRLA